MTLYTNCLSAYHTLPLESKLEVHSARAAVSVSCCRAPHRLADQDVLPSDTRPWRDKAVIIQLVIHTMTHACTAQHSTSYQLTAQHIMPRHTTTARHIMQDERHCFKCVCQLCAYAAKQYRY
jgi:hypothetical protein